MAWPSKGSGGAYNSNCSYARALGGYLKKLLLSVILCRVCHICAIWKRKGKHLPKHECCKNYEGSSKGMESEGILQMAIKAPSQGFVMSVIVSDNDSTMQAHLQYATDASNKKARLPPWILEPKFLADPGHRKKWL